MGTVLSCQILPRQHLDAEVWIGVPHYKIKKPNRLGGAVTKRPVVH
jgi:hypothetical protein